MILPTPQDLPAFERGEPVEVRVRMKPQPDDLTARCLASFGSRLSDATHIIDIQRATTVGFVRASRALELARSNPLGPPGTGHAIEPGPRVKTTGGVTITVGMLTPVEIVTSEPPTLLDGVWWWRATVKRRPTP